MQVMTTIELKKIHTWAFVKHQFQHESQRSTNWSSKEPKEPVLSIQGKMNWTQVMWLRLMGY